MKKSMENTGNTLVSIIISSYNYAPYLNAAIDSALNQSYSNIEVIVVDDGSKDDSPKIISGYGNKIISILKENGGQASSMNAGFKASHGEIIIFLDSDDTLYPDAVENIVPHFENANVSKVHWLLDEIDARGKKTNKIVPKYPLASGDLLEDLIRYGPGKCGAPPYSPPTSGNAWSRDYIQNIMPIPEALYKTNTDKYLHFLAPVYGEMRAIEKILGGYRVHGNNYSLHPILDYANEYLERFEQTCEILEDHLRKKNRNVDTSLWPRDSWFHQIKAGVDDIISVVPNSSGFVLVDENAWGIENEFGKRRRFHLMDRDGRYDGPPIDDEQAIREVERDRKEGAEYIFFTANTFWWLDHYTGLADHLEGNYQRILDNNRLIGFNLQKN